MDRLFATTMNGRRLRYLSNGRNECGSRGGGAYGFMAWVYEPMFYAVPLQDSFWP